MIRDAIGCQRDTSRIAWRSHACGAGDLAQTSTVQDLVEEIVVVVFVALILVVSVFIVVVDFLKHVIAQTRGTERLVVATEGNTFKPGKKAGAALLLLEMA